MSFPLPDHVLDEIGQRSAAIIEYKQVVSTEAKRLRELHGEAEAAKLAAIKQLSAAIIRVAEARRGLAESSACESEVIEAELSSIQDEKLRLKMLPPKEARAALRSLRAKIEASQDRIEENNARLRERLAADAELVAARAKLDEASERFRRADAEQMSGIASMRAQVDRNEAQLREDGRVMRAGAPPGFHDFEDYPRGARKLIQFTMMFIVAVVLAEINGVRALDAIMRALS